jgi:hypothetical protein
MQAPLYLVRGLTTKTRKKRLQERIRRKAKSNAKKGLPTRIPFLKKHICGQDVPNGESSNLSSTKCPWEEAKVGDVFELPVDWKFKFKYKRFLERVALFNAHKAKHGIQASFIPISKSSGFVSFIVSKCEVEYLGDLKVTRVLDPVFAFSSSGQYQTIMFQIFLKDKPKFPWRYVITHELEHAVHTSIEYFYGLPDKLLSSEDKEYLAMLKTIQVVGDLCEFTMFDNPHVIIEPAHFKGVIPGKEKAPHYITAKKFYEALQSKYGLDEYSIAMGVVWSMRSRAPTEVDPSFAEQLGKIQAAAGQEYARTYEQFGLSLEDIREVIDRLPMM